MSLIPELLDPKAQEHIQMEPPSSLFRPGSQAWPLSSSLSSPSSLPLQVPPQLSPKRHYSQAMGTEDTSF